MKRCRALSPGTHWRCELPKGHIANQKAGGEVLPTHKHSWVTWTDDEGTILPKEGYHTLKDFATSFTFSGDFESMARPNPEQQLIDWWMGKAAREAEATVPKAVEYGSTDLIDIGRSLARICDREVSDEEAAEMGVFFYLEGKFARWRSALERGDRPSDDTLLDIGVYVRMAQRIRHSGGWPGTETTK